MTPMTAAPGPMPPEIVYPESDGKRMAENTKQGRWITLLYSNLCAMFHQRDDVFIALDNFWYPVEGEPDVVYAPDVYVVFGRPKGDRSSYKQWLEGDIPLTVVFEILSPANTREEMEAKFLFYDEHGVEEYYVYDPETNKLDIRVRGWQTLYRVDDLENFASPRLGIRFEMTEPEMTVYRFNGLRFRQLEEETQRADAADERADAAETRTTRLAELGRKARRGQSTPEEVAELERLEDESL
jgi:Uma2 family endonuclease